MLVYATVMDARGRLVPDLDQTDFSIEDGGKAAAMSVFSNDSQPFTAVVMLDTSASMAANVELLKRAAGQFLSGLTPADRAQVGAFNDRIQLSGTFANKTNELISELDKLEIGNPTRLHDGIAASLDALRGIEGAASCWCSVTVKTQQAALTSGRCSNVRGMKKSWCTRSASNPSTSTACGS